MGAGKQARGGGEYELGELDLDPTSNARPAAPKPPPAAPVGAPMAQPAGRNGAGDIEFDPFEGLGAEAGPALDLEADNSQDWRGRIDHLVGAEAPADDPLHAPADGPALELDHTIPERLKARGPATGQTRREAAARDLDPKRRARDLAGYGEPPAGFLGALPYVTRVLARQVSLRSERRKVERHQRDIGSRLDEALLELGQAVAAMPKQRLGALNLQLDAVRAASEAMQTADQNATDSRRHTDAQLRELDEEIARLQTGLEPLEAAERAASRTRGGREEDLARAQALLRRVDIERRALEEAQRPLDEARDAEFQAQRSAREQAHARAEQSAAAARSEYAEAQQALGELQRQIQQAGAKRRKLSEQAERAQQKLVGAATGAEAGLLDALKQLGRAAHDAGLDGVAEARDKRVQELDRRYGEAAEQKHIYDLAHRAYDRGAVYRAGGLLLALGAAAASALHFL